MVDGGPNYRELRELFHILREVWREIKKVMPDDEESDGRKNK